MVPCGDPARGQERGSEGSGRERGAQDRDGQAREPGERVRERSSHAWGIIAREGSLCLACPRANAHRSLSWRLLRMDPVPLPAGPPGQAPWSPECLTILNSQTIHAIS